MRLRDQSGGRRPFGPYLDGPRRQGRADFLRELGKFLAPRQLLQARPDQPAGRDDIFASPRIPCPQGVYTALRAIVSRLRERTAGSGHSAPGQTPEVTRVQAALEMHELG